MSEDEQTDLNSRGIRFGADLPSSLQPLALEYGQEMVAFAIRMMSGDRALGALQEHVRRGKFGYKANQAATVLIAALSDISLYVMELKGWTPERLEELVGKLRQQLDLEREALRPRIQLPH